MTINSAVDDIIRKLVQGQLNADQLEEACKDLTYKDQLKINWALAILSFIHERIKKQIEAEHEAQS